MIVYVTEQGAIVGRRRGRLLVSKGGNTLENLHLCKLEQLVIFGQVQLTTDAVRALLEQGVDTVYLTASGRFLGRLSTGLGKNVELRQRQHEAVRDGKQQLLLARAYVWGKLQNCLTLLRRQNRALRSDLVARDAVGLRHALLQVPDAETVERLRGLEGNGSARYFSALRSVFRAPGIAFFRRARRPPPDPVNILLSLGYTLLTNLIHGLCERAGLDPYLGVLHTPCYGRPSLALDLIEEFRPAIVDVAAIRAVNTRHITPSDFSQGPTEIEDIEALLWGEAEPAAAEEEPGPAAQEEAPRPQIVISRAGLKKWFLVFERRLEERVHYPAAGGRLTYRQVLREQVYRFARHLRTESTYAPFLVRS